MRFLVITIMHVWRFSLTTLVKNAKEFIEAHIYIPAIRLFRRYKTINANTVTASDGPTMTYHCTVVLSEKKKKTKQKTKR